MKINKTLLLILSYLFAIVVSNLSVYSFGTTALIFTGLILIPFDLTSRDVLHEVWKENCLKTKMFFLIVSGSLISFIINPASVNISIASAVAFFIAGTIDFVIYSSMIRSSKSIKMNCSNICSSIFDSIVFQLIAFGSIDLKILASQSILKIAGGFLWVFALTRYSKIK